MSVTVRARFDDLVTGDCYELVDERGTFSAWEAKDVPGILNMVEDAVRSGNLIAAGFVSYEAAPGFDPSLMVRSIEPESTLPLAFFVLFASKKRVDPPRKPVSYTFLNWAPEVGKDDHADAVKAIKEKIASGWTYQANFTTRLTCDFNGDPIDLYRQLVTAQSGAYNVYLETDTFVLACASPELFFSFDGTTIISRPMKGTAKRGRFPAEDNAVTKALVASGKERAENLMIVDLVRNDIGRIAKAGSVEVENLLACERYPTVWQLTSTIQGLVVDGTDLCDIFTALFPCGSVTGAPKASTMKLISDLESSPRGVYCGAVGLVASDSDGFSSRFAVAIRTTTIDKTTGIAHYGVGGGITVDSNDCWEWDELMAKTAILTHRPQPDGLFETMRFSVKDGLRNLDHHIARMNASANYFKIPFSLAEARLKLERATKQLVQDRSLHDHVLVEDPIGLWRVRLILSSDGTLDVETEPLRSPFSVPLRLSIDDEPIDNSDPLYFHKTTDRSPYLRRAKRHPEADDVILVNLADEVTETTRANIVILLDGNWWTPPVECGLLPGIARDHLITTGAVGQRVLTSGDLENAEALATISSLRGWLPAVLIPS